MSGGVKDIMKSQEMQPCCSLQTQTSKNMRCAKCTGATGFLTCLYRLDFSFDFH